MSEYGIDSMTGAIIHQVTQAMYEIKCTAVRQSEYDILLKPKLYRDGNMWCALYGEDIASGVCGFGKTPDDALLDFNKSMNKGVEVPQ